MTNSRASASDRQVIYEYSDEQPPIKVIAEGVETQEQRDLLTGAGCDFGQGFLFARPLTAPQFDRLLRCHGTRR